MTPAKLRLALGAMGRKETVVRDLCHELGISSRTAVRYPWCAVALAPDARQCPASQARAAGEVQAHHAGCVIRARLLARSGTTLPRRRRLPWLARRAHRPVRDARP